MARDVETLTRAAGLPARGRSAEGLAASEAFDSSPPVKDFTRAAQLISGAGARGGSASFGRPRSTWWWRCDAASWAAPGGGSTLGLVRQLAAWLLVA